MTVIFAVVLVVCSFGCFVIGCICGRYDAWRRAVRRQAAFDQILNNMEKGEKRNLRIGHASVELTQLEETHGH